MAVLSVYHMDIEDFITAKSKDSETLKHFNISVMVDDDFIKKAENDEEYYVHHPVYDEDGSILNNPEKWIYSKKVSAKKIWDMIIEQAYNYGEPGVLFYDTMNRDNNLWYIEKINATNPCFTGDMSLLTEDGYMTFKELCDRDDISVICPDGTVSHNNKVWCSGIKETIKVIFENNEFVKCTPNHIFMLKDGTECEAKDLCGKKVRTFYPEESTRVVRIEKSKYEPVYDFTENDNHWGVVNGYIVHNCGEYLSGTVYGNDPKTGEKLDRHAFGGSCNLGSLFLHNYVVNPFKKDAYIDYDKLGYAVSVAVNFLDNIIDINTYPDKIYENYQKHFRTIGLGITGLADCLAMLGIRYDSDEAIKKTDEIMDFITLNAYRASVELAKKKGSFPYLDKMKFINSGYLSKKVKNQAWADVVNDIVAYGIRNAKLISVAPVGTLSLTYGNNCSSGMEPIFSLSYDRKVKVGGQDDSNIQIVTLKDYAYSVWESMDGGDFPDKDSVFVTALELDVNKKIDMLATIAKHVDMSVSNTLNIPEEYTFEQVKDVYERSWELGIKGCTIFRPNKLRQGVFVTESNKENKDARELKRGEIVECSDNLVGKKRKIYSGCVDADTEYFNGREWKKISEYSEGELVLQYNQDGTASLVKPIKYIKRPSNGQYHIKTKYGIDMMVSPDHRNVVFGQSNKIKIMTTDELLTKHNKNSVGLSYKFKKSFLYNGSGINLTDDEIRISVAIFADGCFYSPTSKKCLISVRKKRKRDRLVELINRAGIEFSEYVDNDGYYNIKFYPPISGKQKTFPVEWYNATQHQLQVIFDEVFLWDGRNSEHNEYTTVIKSNADFVQFVCTAIGKAASIYIDKRDDRYTNSCYRVDWSDRIYRSITRDSSNKLEIPFVQPMDGYDYCFSVPSTMLVLRRNNNIFVTGNCGSLHILAFFDPTTGDMQEVYLNKGSTGGCVDADTEYFNGKTWKKISEYEEGSFEQVLQYNEDGTASLVIPSAYIVNENVETLKHFYNNTGLDMVLSNDHRMFLYKNYTKFMLGIRKKLTTETITVQEFLDCSSRNRHVPTTFSMNKPGIPIPDNIIRLLVAVYADGTYDGNKIIIGVKKERKKERLRKILEACDIGWTEKKFFSGDCTVFYIHPVPSCKQWFIDKQFTSKWYDCTDEQLKVVIDECIHWDGSVGEGNRLGGYFSSKKEEVDFIQFALTRLGFRATISTNNGTCAKQNSYRVRWTKQNVHGLSTAQVEDYKTTDGRSYCFSVDSGLLVLRRNGRIFITGNCANFTTGLSRMISLSCRAGVSVYDIKDQLDSTGTCPSYAVRRATKHDTYKGSCCPMAIGNAILDMYNEVQEELKTKKVHSNSENCEECHDPESVIETKTKQKCPECGESLDFEGGCVTCRSCGYTKCG